MLNKGKLIYTCERNSVFVERLVDNLLIPLVSEKEKFVQTFLERMQEEYGDVMEELAPDWVHGFVSQHIVHKLLGPERLLKNYLGRPEIKKRSSRERDFLQSQLFKPWRFSFMQLKEDRGDGFFEMNDISTKEDLLLFSPAVGLYEAERQASFYFTLLGFNGRCYQTYGPVLSFLGMQPIDLTFYASQLKGQADSFADVEEMLQKDPLPFMMLIVGANFPLTYHRKDLAVTCLTKLEADSLDLETWRDSFVIEEKGGVYQLGLKRWRRAPHFAHCHFAPSDHTFVASATTERGWEKLVSAVREHGLDLAYEPQVQATMAGAIAVKRLLGKEPFLSPYESMFTPQASPEEEEGLKGLNRFLDLLIPYLNAGEAYNLEELAQEAGISYENAVLLAEQIEAKFKDF